MRKLHTGLPSHQNRCCCRETIREKLIPHAVSWYTGEAIEQEEFGDEDDDEDDEDDEEEDDDEDDEDEDDEVGQGPEPCSWMLSLAVALCTRLWCWP